MRFVKARLCDTLTAYVVSVCQVIDQCLCD